jgi:hypothetical protein
MVLIKSRIFRSPNEIRDIKNSSCPICITELEKKRRSKLKSDICLFEGVQFIRVYIRNTFFLSVFGIGGFI